MSEPLSTDSTGAQPNNDGTSTAADRDKTGKFKKGNKAGKKFNEERQPSDEDKRRGHLKKKAGNALLAAILDQKAEDQVINGAVAQLAQYFNLDPDTLTEEALCHLRMLERVRKSGNIQAYKELMNRRYGFPKAPLEHSGELGLNHGGQVKTIVEVLEIVPRSKLKKTDDAA